MADCPTFSGRRRAALVEEQTCQPLRCWPRIEEQDAALPERGCIACCAIGSSSTTDCSATHAVPLSKALEVTIISAASPTSGTLRWT